jgi:hypothetical protein
MKALLLRSLLVAVLVGPAINLVSTFAMLRGGIKYDPPLSETKFPSDGKYDSERNGGCPLCRAF